MSVTPRAYRHNMGYRGKVAAQEQARAMRARNMTLQDIATELGVAKSSVSLWVRDVPFTPSKRRTGPRMATAPCSTKPSWRRSPQCDAEGVDRAQHAE